MWLEMFSYAALGLAAILCLFIYGAIKLSDKE